MKAFRLGLAALLTTAAVPVSAATVVYTDSTSFNAAAGPTTLVDFEGCAGSGSDAATFCTGLPAGISFTANAFYTAPPLQSSNPSTALGIDLPRSGTNTISFASGTNVFGLDLFQNFGGGTQSGSPTLFEILLYDASNSLIGSFSPLVASNGGSFYGVTSTDPIFRAEVSQPGGFAVVDNVRFASAIAAVPEPATWALLLIGFGFLGGAVRVRRSKDRVVAAYA